MSSNTSKSHDLPNYIVNLEAAYGAPSQAVFGSAVFYEILDSSKAKTKSSRSIAEEDLLFSYSIGSRVVVRSESGCQG